MKWQGRRKSSNVEDQRGQSSSRRGIGSFNPMLLAPLLKLLFSRTGLIIVGLVIVFSFITGYNPLNLIGNFFMGTDSQTVTTQSYEGTEEENEQARFSATILASTEDVWNGTSEQRMRWFKKGFESGDISQGDTFNAKSL